jgi:hypothetical protein
VTLLFNTLLDSDRENVRQAQGLAAHRNPLRQITNRIPLGNRSRSNRHILVMRPDPRIFTEAPNNNLSSKNSGRKRLEK